MLIDGIDILFKYSCHDKNLLTLINKIKIMNYKDKSIQHLNGLSCGGECLHMNVYYSPFIIRVD